MLYIYYIGGRLGGDVDWDEAESLCWPARSELVVYVARRTQRRSFRGTLGGSQQYAAITSRKVLNLGARDARFVAFCCDWALLRRFSDPLKLVLHVLNTNSSDELKQNNGRDNPTRKSDIYKQATCRVFGFITLFK